MLLLWSFSMDVGADRREERGVWVGCRGGMIKNSYGLTQQVDFLVQIHVVAAPKLSALEKRVGEA